MWPSMKSSVRFTVSSLLAWPHVIKTLRILVHKLTQSRVDMPFSGISAKHIKQFTLLTTHHLDVQVRSRPIKVLTACLHMQIKILALIFAVEWNANSVYTTNHSIEFFENWMYMKKNVIGIRPLSKYCVHQRVKLLWNWRYIKGSHRVRYQLHQLIIYNCF